MMVWKLDSQASWDVAARRRGDVRLLLARRLRRRAFAARLLGRHLGAVWNPTRGDLLYSGRQIAPPIELHR
jgi:hypothetical protein